MHLASIAADGSESPVLIDPLRGVVAVADLDPTVSGDLLSLIREERVADLSRLASRAPDSAFQPNDSVT